jgi:hypothetical protein
MRGHMRLKGERTGDKDGRVSVAIVFAQAIVHLCVCLVQSVVW